MTAAPRAAGRRPWLKPAVFAGALVPLAVLLARAARGALGANPIAEALNELGLIALVLLVASLACTPVREVLGWTWPIGMRRMLGLFAFFYASLHFCDVHRARPGAAPDGRSSRTSPSARSSSSASRRSSCSCRSR